MGNRGADEVRRRRRAGKGTVTTCHSYSSVALSRRPVPYCLISVTSDQFDTTSTLGSVRTELQTITRGHIGLVKRRVLRASKRGYRRGG